MNRMTPYLPRLRQLALAGACVLALASLQAQASNPASTGSVPPLEQFFRATPYMGDGARGLAFSHSGRYLAYLWSAHSEVGNDLHVHDTKTGRTLRLSSLQLMKALDAPEDSERFERKQAQRDQERTERQVREVAQQAYLRGESVDLSQWERAAIEKLKAEQAEKKKKAEALKAQEEAEAKAEEKKDEKAEEKKKDEDKQDWEWRDELKKQRLDNMLRNADLYPGVSHLVWANERDELVFGYRGRLLRWRAGQERFELLSQGAAEQRVVGYTPDDRGYLYMEGNKRVMRAFFDRAGAEVINPELIYPDDAERKYKIENSSISDDGRWLALIAGAAPKGADGKTDASKGGRQVEIMSWNERFATARRIQREMADDTRKEPAIAIYIREVPKPGAAPQRQSEPVFSHKGGDTWLDLSDVVWARDGSHYAFVTFEREQELLRVYLGRPGEAKAQKVLERRGKVHPELNYYVSPQFTPDGRELVLALAENGYRQLQSIDLKTLALRPLIKGEFEAYQLLGFSPDSKAAFIVANAEDTAASNVYRLDLRSAELKALGTAGQAHRRAVVSYRGDWLAAVAGDWGAMPELRLIRGEGGVARTLTQSHDPAFGQVNLLQPERFSFKNRHGDLLQAMWFKPAGWSASDKRPAVVYVYGGLLGDRHTVERDNFSTTAYMFGQYMALKHGYVMVALDPRGQSGYGQRFAESNFGKPGRDQAEDLQDLVSYMAEHQGVDRARVGLNGWSFGGFQTQFTMYTQPDLFAAGIAGAGPTEWENYNSWYTGLTIDKREGTKTVLRKHSLIPLARGLRKPLMLVHGMVDNNVLFQDTVNVYRALLESGKEGLVELFLDPEGHHGMDGAVKSVGLHRKYEAFWLQHLGTPPAR